MLSLAEVDDQTYVDAPYEEFFFFLFSRRHHVRQRYSPVPSTENGILTLCENRTVFCSHTLNNPIIYNMNGRHVVRIAYVSVNR